MVNMKEAMSLYGRCIDCKNLLHCKQGSPFCSIYKDHWCAGFTPRLAPIKFVFNGKVVFDNIKYPNGDVTLDPSM